MVTKTISIMEDAYNLLLRKKHEDESFSELIRRITGRKKDIMKFAGAWKDISEGEVESMKDNIRSIRKRATSEMLKKLKEDDMYRF